MKIIGIATAVAFCIGCASGPKPTSHIYTPNSGEAQPRLDSTTIATLRRHAIVKDEIIEFASADALTPYCGSGSSQEQINADVLAFPQRGYSVVFERGLPVNTLISVDEYAHTAIVDPATGFSGYVCGRFVK